MSNQQPEYPAEAQPSGRLATHTLCRLLRDSELFLMERVLEYASRHDYTKHTSTLLEAWRVSVEGLSGALLRTLEERGEIPRHGADDAFGDDPVSRFARTAARNHRRRGITLTQFLGLMKYYREAYLALVREKAGGEPPLLEQVTRYFDRLELGFCSEWCAFGDSEETEQLRCTNRVLANEKNLYLTLLESLRDPAFFLDEHLVVRYLNRAAARLIDPSARAGQARYSDRFADLSFPWFRSELAAVLRHQREARLPELHIDVGGERRTYELRAQRMQDVSGKFRGLAVLAEDVTERRRAEDLRRAEYHKYRRLLESTQTAPWELDLATGRFTFVGRQIVNLLGYPLHYWQDMEAWSQVVHPEDREWTWRFCTEEARRGRDHAFTYRALSADGRTVWIDDLVSVVSGDEGPEKLVGFMRDVTERENAKRALEESEERFQRLFHQAPLAYQSLDEEGRLIEVNETWLRVMGYRRDEVLGRSFSDFLDPDHRYRFREGFPRFKEAGAVHGIEHVMRRKDGSRIVVAFEGKVARDGDGGFLQTHCIMQDVTDARAAEAERRAVELRLREAQKMEAIGTLAGGVAHEFNNLLAVIMGYTQLALERAEPVSEDAEDLEEVLQASRRARDLVKQILAFGRRDKESSKSFAVGPEVEEALRLLRQTLPASLDFRTELRAERDTVHGDPDQVRQMVVNLCTNAYQAVEPEGGRVRVEVFDVEVDGRLAEEIADLAPGRYVAITVADDGPGIPPDVLPRIFEPFFTTREVGSGSGMGLAVVHGLVQAHRGAIRVTTDPRTGTVFTVYLPACAERRDDEPALR